jgi:hypothetical protein
VLAVSLVTIQDKYSLIGAINCYIQGIHVAIIGIMGCVLVFFSMLMTGIVLKERTPMEILRDTAY